MIRKEGADIRRRTGREPKAVRSRPRNLLERWHRSHLRWTTGPPAVGSSAPSTDNQNSLSDTRIPAPKSSTLRESAWNQQLHAASTASKVRVASSVLENPQNCRQARVLQGFDLLLLLLPSQEVELQ